MCINEPQHITTAQYICSSLTPLVWVSLAEKKQQLWGTGEYSEELNS